MRRSAFEVAVAKYFEGDLLQGLLDDLESKGKEAQEKGEKMDAEKCERRRKWLQDGCPYPPSLDSSDLVRFDREMPEEFDKDSSLAWDLQFAAKVLLEQLPHGASEELVHQTVLHLADDAASEGVYHAELMTGLKYSPADAAASDETKQKWASLFSARQEALKAHADLSLMFVIALPAKCKTAEQAGEVLNLMRSVDGFDESAIAGVAYFCGENKLLNYAAPLQFFKDAGFRLVCIHAGEGEPSQGEGPQRVRDAMAVGAERIGHGIEAAADADLMADLRERGVCLEVCPLSNRALGCCPAVKSHVCPVPFCVSGLTQHPLPRLLRAGVECCLSADDPLYWAAAKDGAHGLVREYQACRDVMALDDAALCTMARSSFVHSSAPEEVKSRGLKDIDLWLNS